MFSLPDINKMNERAEQNYQATKNKTAKQILKGQKCEWCDEPAAIYYDWHDLFSDTPKGRLFLCEEHDHYYGSPSEGYFTCDDCGKVFIENYTWEKYYTIENDCEMLCLNCALDRYLADDENWISDPAAITWDRVKTSKHLIPVEGRYHNTLLDFQGNTEFDSMSGECISGGGVKELQELARKAIADHDRCVMVLDGAYQFAVSIAIYTAKKEVPIKN